MKTSTANSINTSDTLQVQATTSHWENNMVVSVSFIYGIVIGIAASIVVVTVVIAIIACLRTLETRLPWTTYELPRIRRSPPRPRSEVAVVEQEHPYSSLATGQPPPVPTRTCTPGDVSLGDLTGDLTSEAGCDTRPPPVPPRPAKPGLTKLRRLTQKLKLPAINGPSKT